MLKQKLKEIRKQTGISQGKLAKLLVERGVKTHCSPSYISSLENRQFTNFELFGKICEVLNLKVEILILENDK